LTIIRSHKLKQNQYCFYPHFSVIAFKKEILMKIRILIRTSIITIIGTSLVACGASLEEYQKFATAGKEYAVALDSLLVTSGNYFVDAIANAKPVRT
jgi:hypothetical protein